MFGFDIFNIFHLAKIPTLRLNGLPGLAFGTLMLATIPVYLAGMKFIRDNKKPFVSLPFATAKKKQEESDDAKPEIKNTESEITLPPDLPTELHQLYLRAVRNDAFSNIKSAFEMDDGGGVGAGSPRPGAGTAPLQNIPDSVTTQPADPTSSFPIPDFDSELEKDSDDAAPTFGDISFGSGDAPAFKTLFDTGDTDNSPHRGESARTKRAPVGGIEQQLQSLGFKTSTDGEIVIAKKNKKIFAIAVHDDSDFTIADSEEWFAAGKQKPSPVAAAVAAAKKHDATPVIYLAENNIMDLENMKTAWTDAGVRVIDDLDDL